MNPRSTTRLPSSVDQLLAPTVSMAWRPRVFPIIGQQIFSRIRILRHAAMPTFHLRSSLRLSTVYFYIRSRLSDSFAPGVRSAQSRSGISTQPSVSRKLRCFSLTPRLPHSRCDSLASQHLCQSPVHSIFTI